MQPVWIRRRTAPRKQQKHYKVISARLMRSTDMMTAAVLIPELDPEEVIPVRLQAICSKKFLSKAP